MHKPMVRQCKVALAVAALLLLEGCAQTNSKQSLRQALPAVGSATQLLAVYEPWFGHPQHISVGYSTQDPVEIRKQIDQAKSLGISGFVIDWYGDREPFIDRSYALIQVAAAEKDFHVAMMYDETEGAADKATDDALAAFYKFQATYLADNAPGRSAYLTYDGRPMIFIFPKGNRTDWQKVKTLTNQWDPAPLLIFEDRKTEYESQFDGFYAWINPGKPGWKADGSNWGEDYLRAFYTKMRDRNDNKIVIGTAWAGFNDSKASWGLNRHMSQRCGRTLVDTMEMSRQYFPASHPLPFLLIATWNDYEEGTAIEAGLAKCDANAGHAGAGN